MVDAVIRSTSRLWSRLYEAAKQANWSVSNAVWPDDTDWHLTNNTITHQPNSYLLLSDDDVAADDDDNDDDDAAAADDDVVATAAAAAADDDDDVVL